MCPIFADGLQSGTVGPSSFLIVAAAVACRTSSDSPFRLPSGVEGSPNEMATSYAGNSISVNPRHRQH